MSRVKKLEERISKFDRAICKKQSFLKFVNKIVNSCSIPRQITALIALMQLSGKKKPTTQEMTNLGKICENQSLLKSFQEIFRSCNNPNQLSSLLAKVASSVAKGPSTQAMMASREEKGEINLLLKNQYSGLLAKHQWWKPVLQRDRRLEEAARDQEQEVTAAIEEPGQTARYMCWSPLSGASLPCAGPVGGGCSLQPPLQVLLGKVERAGGRSCSQQPPLQVLLGQVVVEQLDREGRVGQWQPWSLRGAWWEL